jgi:hypothetical protein
MALTGVSRLMVSLAGPLAMIGCEPRQARKGATVIAKSCAVVWLVGDASNFQLISSLFKLGWLRVTLVVTPFISLD